MQTNAIRRSCLLSWSHPMRTNAIRRSCLLGWSHPMRTNAIRRNNLQSCCHCIPTNHYWSPRSGNHRPRRHCNQWTRRWNRLLKKMNLNRMCPDVGQRLNKVLRTAGQGQVRVVSRRTSMARGLGGGA